MTPFNAFDFTIMGAYALFIIGLGIWVSLKNRSGTSNTKDYFLAGRSLVWWAIGSSCIAANISAEQLIGMTGSGFVMGIAMASYEFASAIILIFVAKYFIPIFIREQIYTIPQFLEIRFNKTVRSCLAVFWIFLYVFVNLTSILYMGALAIHVTLGFPLVYGVVVLALIAIAYSIYGGLTAVAWTDIVQVVLLLMGGLITTWFALDVISGGEGVFAGLKALFEFAPEKFDMVFEKGHPNFQEIPGIIGIVFGIIIVANTFYWGFNQYTIQRALAAKNVREAQKGLMFAGYLKLIMPILVVVPGLAAYVMLSTPEILQSIGNIDLYPAPTVGQADKTYPWLLGLLPNGVKGLAFAALCAAIVSSLASMINSISTLFTVDVYKQFLNQSASEQNQVKVGRVVAVASLAIASFIAPALATVEQAFQYIQEFTGFVSPGIVAIFLLGMFWKRTTAKAALSIAIATLPITLIFYFFIPDMPFLYRMSWVLFLMLGLGVIVSLLDVDEKRGLAFDKELFQTSRFFNFAAIGIVAFLTVFYVIFW